MTVEQRMHYRQKLALLNILKCLTKKNEVWPKRHKVQARSQALGWGGGAKIFCSSPK